MTRCPPIGTLVIARREQCKWGGIRRLGPLIGRVAEVKRLFPEVRDSQAAVLVERGVDRFTFGVDEVWPVAQPVCGRR